MDIGKFFKGIGVWLRAFVFVIASVICFVVTLYLAILDRVAAGGLVGALFVMLVLFHYLPQMEYFQALGVKAQWRARVHEADKIIETLKQSAISSARLTYHTIGWGSRMGSPSHRVIQEIADETDQVLDAVGASAKIKSSLKEDYFWFATLDLYRFFEWIVIKNVQNNIPPIQQELARLDADASSPIASEMQKKIETLRGAEKKIDSFNELKVITFREYCDNRIPVGSLPDDDIDILKNFADRVSGFVESFLANGRIPDEASKLLDMHRDEDRQAFYKKMFGEDQEA